MVLAEFVTGTENATPFKVIVILSVVLDPTVTVRVWISRFPLLVYKIPN